MFRRILVPLDGSKIAEKVLPFVKEEARLHGATIVLLRAIAPLRQSLISVPSVMDNVYDQIGEISQDYLDNLSEQLQADGLNVKTITKKGTPAQCVMDTAIEKDCDLIIIGSHGETNSPRWRFGGIANKIVKEKSSIPLLVVPTNI